VLQDEGEEEFWCAQWWGRTGGKGQAKTDGPFDDRPPVPRGALASRVP
jgi:hypothetical protein